MDTDGGWRACVPDAVLAAVVAAFLSAGALLAPPSGAVPLGYLLPLVGALALVVRRRAPVTVLLATTGCLLGYELLAYPDSITAFPAGAVAAFPALIALFTAVSAGHRLIALAASTVLVLGVLVLALTLVDGVPAREVIQNRLSLAGWLAAAKVLGEVFRQHRAYVRQVEQRAVEAERTRDEVARRRAADERLRIARELHDSLTHNISVIKVQAGVAVHLARKRGEQVPDALLAIQEASREAVRELRATLDVLRQDDADEEPPGSGLDRLDELVARARSTGLPVTVTISGERRALPADVDRAAYRIVQEALTNITRHAGPATASVHLGYLSDGLVVQVDDDGRAAPDAAPVPGVGLIGMRERVTALGGRLRAEPRPEGGFTVRAELPLDPPVRSTQPARPAQPVRPAQEATS